VKRESKSKYRSSITESIIPTKFTYKMTKSRAAGVSSLPSRSANLSSQLAVNGATAVDMSVKKSKTVRTLSSLRKKCLFSANTRAITDRSESGLSLSRPGPRLETLGREIKSTLRKWTKRTRSHPSEESHCPRRKCVKRKEERPQLELAALAPPPPRRWNSGEKGTGPRSRGHPAFA
jgi:hypothetical protein